MLFLVLMVSSMSSYPHNLFEMWQELDPSLDKNLAPEHGSGEISACLKRLAAPGQNKCVISNCTEAIPVPVFQAESFPQPLCTHHISPTNFLAPC